MTPERLEEIRRQNAKDIGTAMHSGCDDYACHCHFSMPEVLAEVDRLRAEVATDDGLLAHWQRFANELAALLGGCPAHGDDCKPHIIERVASLLAENASLRAAR